MSGDHGSWGGFDGLDAETLLLRSAMNHRRIAPQIAVRIGASLCGRLHAAHVRKGNDGKPLGIVHGSIALPLVLIGRDGSVNLARIPEEMEACLQESPEQAAGGRADQRSDIFSAGLAVYVLLTGEQPFLRDTEAATRAAVAACEVPPPSTVAQVPPALDPVLMRALARDPSQRYADARALQLELEKVLAIPGMGATLADVGKLVVELAPSEDELRRLKEAPEDTDAILAVAEQILRRIHDQDARDATATAGLRAVNFEAERPRVQVDCFFADDSETPVAAQSPDALRMFAELEKLGFHRQGVKVEVNRADGERTASVDFLAPEHQAWADIFFSFDAVPSLYFFTPFQDGCMVLTGAYHRHVHRKPRAVLTGVPNQPLPSVLESHRREVEAFKARGSQPYTTWGREERLRATHAFYQNDDTR